MFRILVLTALASCAFVLTGCGGGGDSSAPPAAVAPPEPAPPPPPPPAPPAPPADTTAPTVPANVSAAAQSAHSILVSWGASTDASGIAGYRVFRDGSANPVGTVTTTSYIDTALSPSTSYSYTVVAVDAAPTPNFSAASAPATATTSASAVPPEGVRIGVRSVFSGLTLTAAHSLLRVPHDTTRWVVVQQDGQVLAFADSPDVSTTTPVLDLRDRVVFRNVHGLLGLAFHPNYPTDPRAWAAYTHESSPDVIVLRISEFTSADGGATLNSASEQIVFEMTQPGGHNNGGHLLFGPDNLLYLGIGDGGNDDSNSAQAGNGQLTNNLLGKILRIDVDGTANGRRYRIPAGNPFAANTVCNVDGTGTNDCPEIFAWGFRNPWRWTFDRISGQLWLGDVGSHSREEVNLVTAGGNYGWRCKEGTLDTSLVCGTPVSPLVAPVAEYDHTLGQAVTGGFVYRGSAIAGLTGRYVFSDYSSGFIWHIAPDTPATKTMTQAEAWDSSLHIASFAEDADGELFVVDVRDSAIYKLVPGT